MRTLRAGFTLVEVLIAAAISTVILLAFTLVVLTSDRTERDVSAVTALETDVHEALDRIADQVRAAGSGGPGWSVTSTAIYFNKCTGSASGVQSWDQTRGLYLDGTEIGEDITDSVDNNGNGLVDEAVLVLSGDNLLQGYVRDVAANGLQFVQSGDTITITLTLTRLNPEGVPMSATASTQVNLRN